MRLLVLVFGLALAVAGSAAADPAGDARDVLVKYFAAVKAGDWGGMYDVMAEESRGGQSRDQFRTAREGGLGAELGKAVQTRATYRVGAVRIAEGGKSATADVSIRLPDLRSGSAGGMPSPDQVARAPLHDLERSMQLVVENGAWKVVRPKAALSPEQQERFHKAVRDSQERRRQAQPPAPEKPD
jgi:hypothetical protein